MTEPKISTNPMWPLILSSWLLWVCLVGSGETAQADPPKGYRFPSERDMTGDWRDIRDAVPRPYHVRADFNGDALVDDAWILLRTDGGGGGLFVFMGMKSGDPQIVTLETDAEMVPQNMGVAVVERGKYETACGKRYWDCQCDEPRWLDLKLPAVDYFQSESANSYFWWDSRSNRFRRTWMSD